MKYIYTPARGQSEVIFIKETSAGTWILTEAPTGPDADVDLSVIHIVESLGVLKLIQITQ